MFDLLFAQSSASKGFAAPICYFIALLDLAKGLSNLITFYSMSGLIWDIIGYTSLKKKKKLNYLRDL